MEHNKKPNNPNAFPEIEQGYDVVGLPVERLYPGMTLRDYFAAKAMQSMILALYTKHSDDLKIDDFVERINLISVNAYHYADLMLKQREL